MTVSIELYKQVQTDRRTVTNTDKSHWRESLYVLTQAKSKGVSKGENSAAKNDESFEQALVPLVPGDS